MKLHQLFVQECQGHLEMNIPEQHSQLFILILMTALYNYVLHLVPWLGKFVRQAVGLYNSLSNNRHWAFKPFMNAVTQAKVEISDK